MHVNSGATERFPTKWCHHAVPVFTFHLFTFRHGTMMVPGQRGELVSTGIEEHAPETTDRHMACLYHAQRQQAEGGSQWQSPGDNIRP